MVGGTVVCTPVELWNPSNAHQSFCLWLADRMARSHGQSIKAHCVQDDRKNGFDSTLRSLFDCFCVAQTQWVPLFEMDCTLPIDPCLTGGPSIYIYSLEPP